MIPQKNDNNKIVDLNKVQWAEFYYVTTDGQHKRYTKPKTPTYNNEELSDERAMFLAEYPEETRIERARRKGLIDTWIPVCKCQLSANHRLIYTGKKALSIIKAWRKRIYAP